MRLSYIYVFVLLAIKVHPTVHAIRNITRKQTQFEFVFAGWIQVPTAKTLYSNNLLYIVHTTTQKEKDHTDSIKC